MKSVRKLEMRKELTAICTELIRKYVAGHCNDNEAKVFNVDLLNKKFGCSYGGETYTEVDFEVFYKSDIYDIINGLVSRFEYKELE